MSDKSSLTEEVAAELDEEALGAKEDLAWDVIFKCLVIFLCCLCLTIGLGVNGVVWAPLFGASAFFGLVWLRCNPFGSDD